MDAHADQAVPLGTSIISASLSTKSLLGTPFAGLRQEHLGMLPYAIMVRVLKTRYLQFPDGSISEEFYHMSYESSMMLEANVCYYCLLFM